MKRGAFSGVLQHRGAARDDEQRVVECMRHARQQRPHRREPFVLPQCFVLAADFGLRRHAFRDIADVDHIAAHRDVIEQIRYQRFEIAMLAVLVPETAAQ